MSELVLEWVEEKRQYYSEREGRAIGHFALGAFTGGAWLAGWFGVDLLLYWLQNGGDDGEQDK